MKSIKANSRNYSIELLRILSMLMVLMLHFLIKGQYSKAENTVVNYESWVLTCFSIVAVNCYVLISGYFMCERSFKLSRITNTYIQTLFYSVATFIVMIAIGVNEFSLGAFARSVMPTVFDHYWFVAVYILLLFISPLLNSAINNMSKSKMKLVLFTLVGVFCVINNILKPINPIEKSGGYGLIWFMVLYMTAAYIKKYYVANGKWYKYFLLYIIVAFLNFGVHFLFRDKGVVWSDIMVRDYNNILVYVSSICFFLTFLNFRIKGNIAQKIIGFIAPLTFAVYLIHESPFVVDFLWEKINVSVWCVDNGLFFLFAIGLVLILFLLCCSIEFVRSRVFKLLKIDRAITKLSDLVENKIRTRVGK